jgi:hypothetical protein
MSQSSEFCRHNPLCCFSTSVCCCCLFRYRLSSETCVHPRILRGYVCPFARPSIFVWSHISSLKPPKVLRRKWVLGRGGILTLEINRILVWFALNEGLLVRVITFHINSSSYQILVHYMKCAPHCAYVLGMAISRLRVEETASRCGRWLQICRIRSRGRSANCVTPYFGLGVGLQRRNEVPCYVFSQWVSDVDGFLAGDSVT